MIAFLRGSEWVLERYPAVIRPQVILRYSYKRDLLVPRSLLGLGSVRHIGSNVMQSDQCKGEDWLEIAP
jgi:hypothetical protein